jgi:CyaY protein
MIAAMDRSEFLKLADTCLERVATWLEAFDPDEVDFMAADGVLKIEFPDRVTYVLNRQTATDQMWFAAGARAWHFDWSGETWLDDRDGAELYARLGEVMTTKLGRAVDLGNS